MRNFKLEIEYDGTNYAGWQIQNRRSSFVVRRSSNTIQETIERILSKILQEKTYLIASGRTDAGVHAAAQVANFKTNSTIPAEKLQRASNGLLPDDIAIRKVEELGLSFHSRFSAKSKLYRYMILNQKIPSVFLRQSAYFYPYPLDLKLMRQEARCLLGRHDFRAFCASGSSVKNTIRTIKRISIKKSAYHLSPNTYHLVVIDIEANGFLYNMVRGIVGTLIEIGRGKFAVGTMKRVLALKNRKLIGPSAPARGLCLLKVGY